MFDDMKIGAKVYLWLMGGHTQTGHSAIMVRSPKNGDLYFSMFPKHPCSLDQDSPKAHQDAVQTVSYGSRGMSRPDANSGADVVNHNDKSIEGGSADIKFRFTECLDFDAMVVYLKAVREGKQSVHPKAKEGKFNLIYQNCSATVAAALSVGDTGNLVTVTAPSIWTPNEVETYCLRLLLAIRKLHPDGAKRTQKTKAAL